jgi:tripartite ATP-independent transporter DctP family solute receptor
MKKSTIILMVLCLLVTSLSLFPVMAAPPQYVIRVSHIMDTNSAWQYGMEKFAKIVQEKSNGRAIVKIFANSQLGGEKESLEGLRLGTVEMTITSANMLANFFPKTQVFDMPYIFKNSQQCRKVLKGKMGREVAEEMRKATGIRILDWWQRGARNLTANKMIKTPDEVKGIKIRVPQSPLYVDIWKALGANPTPMGWSEVFMGLQQGTIDAEENPLEFIYSNSVYDVQKYVMLTEHVRIQAWIAYSDRLFNQLPKDIQTVVQNAVKEAGLAHDKLVNSQEKEYAKKLEAKGMKIVPVNQALFAEKTKDVYKKYIQYFGEDLYQKIKNAK